MKTIFITCFRGITSRNILATDVLNIVAGEPNARVVVVTSAALAPLIRREFGNKVIVEEAELSAKYVSETKYIAKTTDRFLWILATNLLFSGTRSIQRRVKLADDKNKLDYVLSVFTGAAGRLKFVRVLFRFIAAKLAPGREFDRFFVRYKPDLVFSTDVFTIPDVKMMRAGRRHGVYTVGMVRSWDNPTSWTLLSHIPDHMVVNSERIRNEIMYYGDMPGEKIFVCGVPHYDNYRPERCIPRDIFRKKLGISDKEKLIFLCAPSDQYLKNNPLLPVAVRALGGINSKVLVRLALVGKVDMHGTKAELKEIPKNVIFDDPGTYENPMDVYLNADADRHLASCINAADIVITWASTMIVDAAVFDKPIVLIGFDASPRPYHKSIRRYYDHDHQRFIISTEGVRLAKTPEELSYWSKRYLENPRLDEGGRRVIVGEFAGEFDGGASRRLGRFLLSKLA